MSGDVQPRRRKDKKKKRDDRKSEGEVNLSRQHSFQEDDESSHGVESAHMGTDDQHIHVHHDAHTGGHWCAKILFFILMAVMLGLVGMIMLETRGLSDLDTPLSESRYSNYLHGWVEEHRDEHDDHDKVTATSAEEHDEHDEHDEPPYEEEEDHSEVEEEEEEEAGENTLNDKEEDENVDNGNEDEVIDINEDDDEDDEEEDDDDDEGKDDNDDIMDESENDQNHLYDENEDVDDDENINEDEHEHQTDNDDDDADDNEEPINVTEEIADVDDDDDDDDGDDNLVKKYEDNLNAKPTETFKTSSRNAEGVDAGDDDDDDFFDEEDEASEDIFLENDAGEVLMLKTKETLKRGTKEIAEGEEEEAAAEKASDDKPDTATSYLSRQIKEKPIDGGPLAQDEEFYSYATHDRDRRPHDIFDDIVYEDEMARANDELLRQFDNEL